jgi:hypothetical protein
MDWAFSVNVLGFLEKRLVRSTPYETRNLAFRRAMGAPREKIQKCRRRRGRWPPLPAPYTSEFFPGGPHVKKFGRNLGNPRQGEENFARKNPVSYRSILI